MRHFSPFNLGPCGTLVLAGISFSDIGDFTALQAGNTWTYLGSQEFGNSRDSLLRILSVESIGQSEQGTWYDIRIHDSLFQRSDKPFGWNVRRDLSDTVDTRLERIQEPRISRVDSLRMPYLNAHFYRREVPDSLLGQADTVWYPGPSQSRHTLSGPVRWQGANRHLYARASIFYEAMVSSWDSVQYLQNVGLTFRFWQTRPSGHNFGWAQQRYRLIAFNGIPIADFPVSLIRTSRFSDRHRPWLPPNSGNRSRDLLGRKIPYRLDTKGLPSR